LAATGTVERRKSRIVTPDAQNLALAVARALAQRSTERARHVDLAEALTNERESVDCAHNSSPFGALSSPSSSVKSPDFFFALCFFARTSSSWVLSSTIWIASSQRRSGCLLSTALTCLLKFLGTLILLALKLPSTSTNSSRNCWLRWNSR